MTSNDTDRSSMMIENGLNEKQLHVDKEPVDNALTPDVQGSGSFAAEHQVRYAGFWMRFWAYLLDLIIIGSVERILINPIFRLLKIPLIETNMFAPISIATAVIFYLYFVLMTRFFNQTLGKMVFGLKVINLDGKKLSWGTILFREWIGRFISVTIWVGYVIVAFLPKKQGLHDIFTDTTVIHEGK